MVKKLFSKTLLSNALAFLLLAVVAGVTAGATFAQGASPRVSVQIDPKAIGFKIPDFTDILTFFIRAFFVVAGLAALFYLLLGAFSWVTSGGDKDAISGARDKIQAAVVGLILIIAVLAIIVTLEQIVFAERLCLGLSCPASIPVLLEPAP